MTMHPLAAADILSSSAAIQIRQLEVRATLPDSLVSRRRRTNAALSLPRRLYKAWPARRTPRSSSCPCVPFLRLDLSSLDDAHASPPRTSQMNLFGAGGNGSGDNGLINNAAMQEALARDTL